MSNPTPASLALRPRSMPPPAPPSKATAAQSPAERELLRRFRKSYYRELAARGRLSTLLKGRPISSIARAANRQVSAVWELLVGRYNPAKVEMGTVLLLASILGCTAKEFFDYLIWAHDNWPHRLKLGQVLTNRHSHKGAKP